MKQKSIKDYNLEYFARQRRKVLLLAKELSTRNTDIEKELVIKSKEPELQVEATKMFRLANQLIRKYGG